MSELHFPWLECAVLVPLLGAIAVRRSRSEFDASRRALFLYGLTLVVAIGAWLDFDLLHVHEADDLGHLPALLLHRKLFVLDQLSAPLLPLAALLYFLTAITQPRTKIHGYTDAKNLVSEGLLLATLCGKDDWILIALTILSAIPVYLELRARNQATRVFVLYTALFAALVIMGQAIVDWEGSSQIHTLWALVPLLGAIFIRSGIFPLHGWMTDLFERASFGTALLHVAPLTGAYLAVRLVMPIAPDWVLRGIGWVSLVTAIYAGGMALVQRDGRRFFCFLFLSHSALVLVGLEAVTPIGLTGALCVWLTVGMSLGGLGLTLRALEARRGRLSLTSLQGMYDHTPDLAVSFLLTGLASVGFPGMAGFVGAELLVDGVVEAYPLVGVTVVIAAALAGIAIVKAYFFLFTGPCHQSSIPLHSRPRLRWSMLILVALVLLGGVFPQPGVKSRFEAATELLHLRAERGLRTLPDPTDENEHDSGSHAPPFVAG